MNSGLGVCRDCALKENCTEYKPYKSQCEDYESVPKTNEDWLHSMNIEQLAGLIIDIIDNDIYANNGVLEQLIIKLVGVREKELRKKIVVDWLRQEYKQE